MNILPASLRDLGPLRKLEQACFGKDAWPILDLIAVLTFSDVVRFKAIMDDQMIGFVAGDTRRRDGLAWIAIIAVDPQYRRQGVGRALLLACESKLNVPSVRLTVRLSNSAAIALYEKEGYRTADIWKGYYYDGEDGLVMEKGL